MSSVNILEKISENFGDAIVESGSFRGDDTIVIKLEKFRELCRFIKFNADLNFDYLLDVCGVDYIDRKPRFDVVYHLSSIAKKHRLRVKVRVDEGIKVPSVTSFWKTADWTERETYDMFGIEFDGHPDLKRIYMDDNWKGFPLRKDYPEKGYKDDLNPFGEEV